MCKKRLSLHIALLFILAQCAPSVAFAQTTLVFSGNDNLNNWVPLHHVTITNLTRNWSNTIYYPDTTYTMFGVGIGEQTATTSQLAVSQNTPNPFYGTTSVTTSLSSTSTVLMEVMDLSGRIIVSAREKLSPGAHVFRIDLQKPQTYLLKVSAGQEKAVIKMMNVGGAGSNKIQYRGEGISTNTNLKSSTDCTDYPFESGDRMMFVGYMMDDSLYISSDTIEQIQLGDEDIRLPFRLWDASWEPRHYIDTSALFIPDGVECNNSCFAVKTIIVNDYDAGDIVSNVNDVRYVRLKMEHSYIGDLYIRLTCPNGQHTTLMKKKGQPSTSGCAGQIPSSDFGWQDASASGGAYFGWYNKTDANGNCNPALNPQGNGWNYCWSCDTSSGYQYACGSGFVYNSCNHVQSANPFYTTSSSYVDSTNMAAMTNVYRPDMSFSSLAGCPLNGVWSIDILDVASYDNGYLYDFELVLKEDTVYHYNPTYYTTPSVSTLWITPNNTHSVICNGNVTDEGDMPVTRRGICWSESQQPTINDHYADGGQGPGLFSALINNLTGNTRYYLRAYAINDLGIAYGHQISFVFSPDTACVTPVVDIDGNVYSVVKIGNQCWMRENMKVTHFPDGTYIPEFTTTIPYTWAPGRCTLRDVNIFGYHYTWPAAKYGASIEDSVMVQGLCPDGWHLPAKYEWDRMIQYVQSQPQYQCYGTPAYIAKAIASTEYWMYAPETCSIGDNTALNNASGFSILPAGELGLTNNTTTSFWSSTYVGLSSNGVFHKTPVFRLNYFSSAPDYILESHNNALSIRCLRDN
jgi:uncharacterized protein (TIGR02145 family)